MAIAVKAFPLLYCAFYIVSGRSFIGCGSIKRGNEPMSEMQPIRVSQIMGRMAVGGVEATIMNHYRFIDHNRVNFDFIVDEDSPQVPDEEIRSLGGRVFRIPKIKHIHRYDKALYEVLTKTKPNIVHSNVNALSVFPLRIAKKAGIPIRIAHNHSMSDKKEFTRNTIKNMLRPLSRIYPTDLAACTAMAGEWLFGTDAVKRHDVHIIKNAIDVNRFTFSVNSRESLRSQYGLGSKFIIGQVGRLVPQKNYMFSMEVFAEVLKIEPNAAFVGLGEGRQRTEIERRAEELGIADSVYLLGNQSNVNEWNSAFDVLLFPSLYEGAGMTATEAQASLLPIVGSNNVPAETFIERDLITVLSLTESAAVWANRILEVGRQQVNRMEKRTELASHGYDIRESAQALQTWYESLVN